MNRITKKQKEKLRPYIIAGIRANTAKWDAEYAIERIIGREISDFTPVWDMACVEMATPGADIPNEFIDYAIKQLSK